MSQPYSPERSADEPARGDVVLVSVASIEGEELGSLLRSRGFEVVALNHAQIEARLETERPRVVVLDIDVPGAVVVARKILNESEAAVLCVGDPVRAIELRPRDLDDLFERPLDLARLCDRVAQIAIPSTSAKASRGTTPPPFHPPRASVSPPGDSVPPISDFPRGGDPLDMSSFLPAGEEETQSPASALSPDLRALLEDAERRAIELVEKHASMSPPSENGDVSVPEPMLALLAEPLDPLEEDAGGTGSEEGTGSKSSVGEPIPNPSETTGTLTGTSASVLLGTAAFVRTSAGTQATHPSWSQQPGTPPPRPLTSILPEGVFPAQPDIAPPPVEERQAPVRFQEPRVVAEGRNPFAFALDAQGPAARPAAPIDPPRRHAGAERATPTVFGARAGHMPLAAAIAARKNGALAFITEDAKRRVVFHDGDLVTAASDREDESLLAFLMQRGDVDRDTAAAMAGRSSGAGRHAGAALIAQGLLAQGDLWPVLRGHAEWLIARILESGPGTVELEDDPPGRLGAEPSVFGGAAGAEVLVDLARRVFSNEDAIAMLGGRNARLDVGKNENLLGECALSPEETAVVRSIAGRAVFEVLIDLGEDFAPALFALAELGVASLVTPVASRRTAKAEAQDEPLDDEAVRAKVRARVALVRDGDYFAVLGVSTRATGYEIKRAYLDLRRTFEPTRLLTARTADLLPDLELVLEVLEEAYDILRDEARRERYRRAAFALPADA